MVDITKTSSLTTLGSTTGKKATSGTASTTTGSTATNPSDPETLKSQFLNILLTQMQNQNPLDPMDTKEFTGQLAQFSSLEQQINTNSKLDNLVTAMNSNASTSAFNYIGQTAELNSKDSAVTDGSVNWNYTVDTAAKSLTIKVKDADGKVLFTKDLSDVASGTYSFKAVQADLNSTVTDGQVLSFEVAGKDATDKAVTSSISTVVKVDGVESSSSGIDLRSGGLLYGLDDVIRFKTVAATTPTTTPTTTA